MNLTHNIVFIKEGNEWVAGYNCWAGQHDSLISYFEKETIDALKEIGVSEKDIRLVPDYSKFNRVHVKFKDEADEAMFIMQMSNRINT